MRRELQRRTQIIKCYTRWGREYVCKTLLQKSLNYLAQLQVLDWLTMGQSSHTELQQTRVTTQRGIDAFGDPKITKQNNKNVSKPSTLGKIEITTNLDVQTDDDIADLT